MLRRLIRWAESVVNSERHEKSARADVPAEATGEVVVRRFQNQYDCGYPWPPGKLAPEFCPVHGEGCNPVYKDEDSFSFTANAHTI